MPDTSWQNYPGTAQIMLEAARLGQQVSQEKQRLQQEQVNAQMEAQARADAQQQENLRNQARIQTEKAYHQQEIQLRQQQLDQAAQVQAQKLKSAARTAMAHQKLNGLLQQGVPLEKALLQVPELATPQNLLESHKQGLDLGTQRLEQRKQEFAEKQAENQRRADAAANKQVELGEETTEESTPSTDTTPGTRKTVRRKIFGQPDGSGLTPPPIKATGKVRVKGPDGKSGLVPAENLDQFLQHGYTRVQQ